MDFENVRVVVRPGDATGVGTTVMSADSTGVVVSAPAQFRRGSNIVPDYVCMGSDVVAAAVDRGFFTPTAGTWELIRCSYVNRVVGSDGGAVTADIMACTAGQAPASGTTCLAAVDTINLKATVDTPVAVAVAATRPQVGVGGYFGINFGGTLTAVVSRIHCEFQRVG